MSRTLILSGLGLNCEEETELVCRRAGGKQIDVVHFLDFVAGKYPLANYDFLIFIGGFLDGDHLGSARMAVNRLKFQMNDFKEQMESFLNRDCLVLGICNGFQLLVKLGFFPDEGELLQKQRISLTQNTIGKFENRWVHLTVPEQSPCIFTEGVQSLYLPVRHGEGRLVIEDNDETEGSILNQNLVALQYTLPGGEIAVDYPENPNGSWNSVAGLTNKKGNVFGLMPHPEAYHHYTHHPSWTKNPLEKEDGEGMQIFRNAYKYLS